MKFFCLLFAVCFFFAVRAHDPGLDQEKKLQPEKTLEGFPELEDQDEALQGIQEEVPEDPGNILQLDFTQCRNMGYDCYLLTCPRGTVTVGSCNMMYRCCMRKGRSIGTSLNI